MARLVRPCGVNDNQRHHHLKDAKSYKSGVIWAADNLCLPAPWPDATTSSQGRRLEPGTSAKSKRGTPVFPLVTVPQYQQMQRDQRHKSFSRGCSSPTSAYVMFCRLSDSELRCAISAFTRSSTIVKDLHCKDFYSKDLSTVQYSTAFSSACLDTSPYKCVQPRASV